LARGVWGRGKSPMNVQGRPALSFSFPAIGKGAERRGQRERRRSPEGLPFGAGLGWREAQRRGLGTAQVPNGKRAAELFPVQPRDCSGGLILIKHHYRDGWLWVVNVKRAANGCQPDKPWAVVVVADVQCNRQAVATGAAAENGKPGHCDYIPEAPGFVLGFNARRHGHVSFINCAGEKNRETDSGFLRGLGDFYLCSVGHCL